MLGEIWRQHRRRIHPTMPARRFCVAGKLCSIFLRIGKMGAFRAFSAVAFFTAVFFLWSSFAEAFGCKLEMPGYTFSVVRNEQGQQFIYQVSSSQPKWKIQPFGYATALIDCSDCKPHELAQALIWIAPIKKPLENPDIAALQNALNARRGWMPAIETFFDSGKMRGEAKAVQIGGLAGWQTEFVATQHLSDGTTKNHDVIEVTATDGCGLIYIRMETSPSGKDEAVSTVKDMISAIQVTRTAANDQTLPELLEAARSRAPPPEPEIVAPPVLAPRQSTPTKQMDFQDFLIGLEKLR